MKKFDEPVGRKVYGNFFKDGYFEGRESGSIIPPAYGYYVIPEKDWISQHRILLAILADREQLREALKKYVGVKRFTITGGGESQWLDSRDVAREALKKSDEVENG